MLARRTTIRRHCLQRPAFTLLELLVVISIMALLLSLLFPALSRLRAGAKAVKCMANLRVVAFDFQLFANEQFAEERGDSSAMAGGVFDFHDFAEREYRIAEFWSESDAGPQKMDAARDHMLCPSVPAAPMRIPDTPCNEGAILPREDIGYSFNARLYRRTIFQQNRAIPDLQTRVRSDILRHPNVPIAFDVDGEAAVFNRADPYFTAPRVENYFDIYWGANQWFPAYRHTRKINVIFVGGYVRSATNATAEPGWDWKYQPE